MAMRRFFVGVLSLALVSVPGLVAAEPGAPATDAAVARERSVWQQHGGPLATAARAAVVRLALEPSSVQPNGTAAVPPRRAWIRRHPAMFASLVGFSVGFAGGYAAGNPRSRGDPSSDYLTPEESGVLYGGIGALAGASVVWMFAH
jgi:hypothetical protein